eukprot:667769-Pleurochrysis_carterae.AAC.2
MAFSHRTTPITIVSALMHNLRACLYMGHGSHQCASCADAQVIRCTGESMHLQWHSTGASSYVVYGSAALGFAKVRYRRNPPRHDATAS